jgi:hypothetical protein
MPNYVANYRKKLEMLERKKRVLVRLLERHGTDQQLAIAAEAVRAAQLRALEAKRAQIPPDEANAERLRRLDEEIRLCQTLPTSDIIRESQRGHRRFA